MSDAVDFLLLPEQSLPCYIHNARDVYEHRSLLMQLLFSEYTVNYLTDVIIASVKSKSRFRTLDCLRVIRAVLRNNPFDLGLASSTISKLFYLHQTFIFHRNEQVRACANMLVKSQRLDDESIEWIIANSNKSAHLLNRLLRYPTKNSQITQWAKQIYQSGKLKSRISEVIALLIDENVPPYVKENRSTLVWSIYHARISDETKQTLLMENYTSESADALWKVATKLKYSQVLDYMRQKVRERNGGQQSVQPSGGVRTAKKE